ncbi:hypothetical protein D7Z54_26905 [Salibacterium salarium]|uniref:Uncharacterized protein n=1 Tax=Salibacterium salarium TaxID=284579 RepID=A0A428MVS0_9BACI|nr:hypothetical protein [Salibacterium salarium]RSL30238.1 hypothetical protein D7Z54_26905 [Salibacterium salarium]
MKKIVAIIGALGLAGIVAGCSVFTFNEDNIYEESTEFMIDMLVEKSEDVTEDDLEVADEESTDIEQVDEDGNEFKITGELTEKDKYKYDYTINATIINGDQLEITYELENKTDL